MYSRSLLGGLAAALMGSAPPQGLSQVVTHHLRIAASTSLPLTNSDVDSIIKGMNAIIETKSKSYAWDNACPSVRFVRDGDVFHSANLSETGTFESLSAELKRVSPESNVLVVAHLDCSNTHAAGCGPIGSEPEIVGADWPDYDAQIWLHERGHNVGLQHSAEGPLDDTQEPINIGMRFMFWQIGDNHIGKLAPECIAFANAKFASVTRVSLAQNDSLGKRPTVRNGIRRGQTTTSNVASLISDANGSPALPPTKDKTTQPAATQTAGNSDDEMYAQLRKLRSDKAASLGLTDQAFSVIGHPWQEGPPLAKIKQLTPQDIDSIRNFTEKPPSQYTDNAYSVIGLVGDETDVSKIKSFFSRPTPAAPPGPLTAQSRQQLRYQLSARFASLEALGNLAKRKKSNLAVEALTAILDVKRTTAKLGLTESKQVSFAILGTLSKIPNDDARSAVEAAISASAHAQAPSAGSSKDTVTIRLSKGRIAEVPILNRSQSGTLGSNLQVLQSSSPLDQHF